MTNLNGNTALLTGSVQGTCQASTEALAGAGARTEVHGLAGEAEARAV